MPPIDPLISRIVAEADRIKQQEAKAADKENKKDQPKIFRALDIESLRAYRVMYPHPPTATWLFAFLIVLAGFLSTLIDEPLFTHDRLIFGVLTGLCILYGIFKGQIMPIIWYVRCHTWRKHIPFTLNGWEEFGSSTHLLDSLDWRNLTIRIESQRAPPEFDTALDAIVTILIRDIMNAYYEEDVGERPRAKWTWDPKRRTIAGSANSQVFGLLIDFFREPMSRVINKYGTQVIISMNHDGGWYHVKEKPMGQTVG